ncbi:MAG: hypothetical protein JSS77_08625 [Acidobacteria bacterium]|nr:hypothetical protein [Acidobacteriota bacterium]
MANETHTLTFFPLGNADTTRIDLDNGRKVLFDYAHLRNDNGRRIWYGKEIEDKRIDLKKVLKEDLDAAKKDHYDVVAFTHLDDDHTRGAENFFWLEHSTNYQGKDRIKIKTMWVPAAVIIESRNDLEPSAKLVQAEARDRFKKGSGIIVFSRPGRLREWCERNDVDFENRQGILYDAGQLAPGFDIGVDGLEFFIHAPHGHVQDERDDVDRNNDCLVMQVLFNVQGVETSVLLTSDAKLGALSTIVGATKKYRNEKRLESHLYKNPHHCSYHSVGEEKGEDKTSPHPDIKWLLEVQGQPGLIQIVSSEPIPAKGTEEDKDKQPPHREADAYYREVQDLKDGDYEVTMSHPRGASKPEPIRVVITSRGPELQKEASTSAAIITGSKPPRAGNGNG